MLGPDELRKLIEEAIARGEVSPDSIVGYTPNFEGLAVDAANRDLSLLHPAAQIAFGRVQNRLRDEYGIEANIIEGLRSQERQQHLYDQGRTRPGPIVTKTLESRHKHGNAVDFMLNGKWANEDPDAYRALRRVALEEGLKIIGDDPNELGWDPGHVEFVMPEDMDFGAPDARMAQRDDVSTYLDRMGEATLAQGSDIQRPLPPLEDVALPASPDYVAEPDPIPLASLDDMGRLEAAVMDQLSAPRPALPEPDPMQTRVASVEPVMVPQQQPVPDVGGDSVRRQREPLPIMQPDTVQVAQRSVPPIAMDDTPLLSPEVEQLVNRRLAENPIDTRGAPMFDTPVGYGLPGFLSQMGGATRRSIERFGGIFDPDQEVMSDDEYMAQYGIPGGASGVLGAVVGTLGPELAQMYAGGAPLRAAAGAYRASRLPGAAGVGRTISDLASRYPALSNIAGDMAFSAPYDIAQAARPETSLAQALEDFDFTAPGSTERLGFGGRLAVEELANLGFSTGIEAVAGPVRRMLDARAARQGVAPEVGNIEDLVDEALPPGPEILQLPSGQRGPAALPAGQYDAGPAELPALPPGTYTGGQPERLALPAGQYDLPAPRPQTEPRVEQTDLYDSLMESMALPGNPARQAAEQAEIGALLRRAEDGPLSPSGDDVLPNPVMREVMEIFAEEGRSVMPGRGDRGVGTFDRPIEDLTENLNRVGDVDEEGMFTTPDEATYEALLKEVEETGNWDRVTEFLRRPETAMQFAGGLGAAEGARRLSEGDESGAALAAAGGALLPGRAYGRLVPVWSRMVREVNQMPRQAPASQYLKLMEKSIGRGRAHTAELRKSGALEWLMRKGEDTVTRDEITSFLQRNLWEPETTQFPRDMDPEIVGKVRDARQAQQDMYRTSARYRALRDQQMGLVDELGGWEATKAVVPGHPRYNEAIQLEQQVNAAFKAMGRARKAFTDTGRDALDAVRTSEGSQGFPMSSKEPGTFWGTTGEEGMGEYRLIDEVGDNYTEEVYSNYSDAIARQAGDVGIQSHHWPDYIDYIQGHGRFQRYDAAQQRFGNGLKIEELQSDTGQKISSVVGLLKKARKEGNTLDTDADVSRAFSDYSAGDMDDRVAVFDRLKEVMFPEGGDRPVPTDAQFAQILERSTEAMPFLKSKDYMAENARRVIAKSVDEDIDTIFWPSKEEIARRPVDTEIGQRVYDDDNMVDLFRKEFERAGMQEGRHWNVDDTNEYEIALASGDPDAFTADPAKGRKAINLTAEGKNFIEENGLPLAGVAGGLLGAAGAAGGGGDDEIPDGMSQAGFKSLVLASAVAGAGGRAIYKNPGAMTKAFRKFYQRTVDSASGIYDAVGEAAGPAARQETREQVRQALGADRAAENFLKRTVRDVLPGLSADARNQMNELLKAERGIALSRAFGPDVAEKKLGKDLTQLQVDAARLRANPEVAQAADRVQQAYLELLNMRLDTGLIDKNQYDALVSAAQIPDGQGGYRFVYIPFTRDVGDDVTSTIGFSKYGIGESNPGFQKMDHNKAAADLAVQDPLESLATHAQQVFNRSMNARAYNRAIDYIESNPDVASSFLRKLDPNESTTGKRVIPIMRNGVRENYEIIDDALFESLGRMGSKTTDGLLMGTARKAKNLLRMGITSTPMFGVYNMARDAVIRRVQNPFYDGVTRDVAGGAAIGGTGGFLGSDDENRGMGALGGALAGAGGGPFATAFLQNAATAAAIWDLMKGGTNTTRLANRLGADIDLDEFRQMYEAWERSGGSGGSFMDDFGDARMEENLQRMARDGTINDILSFDRLRSAEGIGGKAKGLVEDVLAPFEALSRAMEESTRLNVFADNIDRSMLGNLDNMTDAQIMDAFQEAAFKSRDATVDFSRMGSSQSIRGLSGATAFFNAQLQGYDKFSRTVKELASTAEGRKKIAAITGMSGALSGGLWLNNAQREDWKDIPLWERNNFWLIPKGREEGSGYWRIPKPFEFGLPASMMERILDVAVEGEDFGAGNLELANQMLRQYMPGGGALPIPTIAAPALEVMADKDFYRGMPINPVSDAFTKVPNSMQYDERTSSVARGISGLLGGVVSPAEVDHLIRGYTGTVGSAALDMSTRAAQATGVDRRARQPAYRPLGRLTTAPTQRSQRYYGFRTDLDRSERKVNAYEELLKSGQADKARRYLERNREAIQQGKRLMRVNDKLVSPLNRRRREIIEDRNLSASQRRQELRKINQAISDLMAAIRG